MTYLPSTERDKGLHIDLLYPSEFVKAGDLRGLDVTQTIGVVKKENLKTSDGEKCAVVIEFAEQMRKPPSERKRLVLNKTNAKTIAAMYGPIADQWVGRRITLYPTTCMAFGKEVECIRIRPTVPPEPQRRSEPQPASEVDPRGQEPEETPL